MIVDKAKLVREILMYVLFKDEETANGFTPNKDNAAFAEGLINTFAFHPGRLKEKKEEIRNLLNEMDSKFHKDTGGGYSFLNLPLDKHGIQWCEQPTASDLIALGIGVGMAEYCIPRDMWYMFPGGVPYVVFNTKVE